VRITDGRMFDEVAGIMDRRSSASSTAARSKERKEKYDRNLRFSEVFNASMAWDLDTFVTWQERHGVEMEGRPLEIFQAYLERGHPLFMSLVEHPTVAEPERFTNCSIVLQRAVIFHRNGREDLFLRSFFHSSNGEEAVNFAPSGAVQMSFMTDSIWFPLALTEGIPEQSSEVVLDIVSDTTLSPREVPEPFEVVDISRVGLGIDRFEVTRIAGVLDTSGPIEDLQVSVDR
jgi:hypothetical protein